MKEIKFRSDKEIALAIDYVRRLLKEKGRTSTQKEFCDQCGLNTSILSSAKGGAALPENYPYRVVRAFQEVSLAYLTEGKGDPFISQEPESAQEEVQEGSENSRISTIQEQISQLQQQIKNLQDSPSDSGICARMQQYVDSHFRTRAEFAVRTGLSADIVSRMLKSEGMLMVRLPAVVAKVDDLDLNFLFRGVYMNSTSEAVRHLEAALSLLKK